MERLNQTLVDRAAQGNTLAPADRLTGSRGSTTPCHTVGDRLLQAVSERLKKVPALDRHDGARATRSPRATRWRASGGRVHPDINDIGAGRTPPRSPTGSWRALNEPFKLEEQEVFVTGSIGISLFPHDGKGGRGHA